MVAKKAAAKKATPVKKATVAKKAAPKKAAPAVEEAVETVAAATDGATFRQFLSDLHGLVGQYMKAYDTGEPVIVPDGAGDDAEEESGEQTREERKAELEAMNIRSLRTMLIKMDYPADEVKEADLETLVTNILDEEFGEEDEDADSSDEDEDADEEDGDDEDSDEEDEDESDDEDDDSEEDEDESEGEGEEEGYTREDLLSYSLREVKRIAREEYEVDADDLKGQDKDSIIDMLIGDGDEEDADEEEEDGDFYTEEDLQPMKLLELRDICDEAGIKYTKTDKKPELIAKILG